MDNSSEPKGTALEKISFSDPLLKVYAIAASIMILKAVMMSWLTVYRMMKVNGGFRSPEDVKKTLLNPNPSEGQLAANEYVDRIRRIQLQVLGAVEKRYDDFAGGGYHIGRAAAPVVAG